MLFFHGNWTILNFRLIQTQEKPFFKGLASFLPTHHCEAYFWYCFLDDKRKYKKIPNVSFENPVFFFFFRTTFSDHNLNCFYSFYFYEKTNLKVKHFFYRKTRNIFLEGILFLMNPWLVKLSFSLMYMHSWKKTFVEFLVTLQKNKSKKWRRRGGKM